MALDPTDEKLLKKVNSLIQLYGEMAPETREKILIGLLSDPICGTATDSLHVVAYVTSLFGEAGLPIKTQEDADEAQLFMGNVYQDARVEEKDEKRWQRKIKKYVKECKKNNLTPSFRGAHNLIYEEVYKEARTDETYAP